LKNREGGLFTRVNVEIFGMKFPARALLKVVLRAMNITKKCFLQFCLTILLLGVLAPNFAQIENIDRGYFSSPLELEVFLAGSFAELRSNHFHSGIDIKTEGVEGKKVLAAAEGYLSRVKISAYGYGKMLYITHPNGFTTTYAHLKRMSPRIEAIVQQAHASSKSYEIDVTFPPDSISVTRGEFIAYSGNTGGSRAPHLHFEIRETSTERPINPLLFDFGVKDNIPPTLKGLRVYPMNDSSFVSGRIDDRSYLVSGSGGKYTIKNNETIEAKGDITFGVHTIDLLNGFANPCGIYSIKLFHNEQLVFHNQFDSLNFDTWRAINTYKDFNLFKNNSWHYHRSYVAPNNPLGIYKTALNNGIISFKDGNTHKMRYEISDTHGNVTTLNFNVKASEKKFSLPDRIIPESQVVFKCTEENIFRTEDLIVEMPPFRLYEDIDFQFNSSNPQAGCIAPLFHLHNTNTPVDKLFTVKIKLNSISDELAEKAVICKVNGASYTARGGRFKDGWISTRVKEFGVYTVRIDTVAPGIKPINVFNGKSMAGVGTIDFNISDYLSGIKHFEAYIGEEWVLMEYEPKNARITHTLEKGRFKGEKEFLLRVTDERNNSREWRATLKF
jgi:hypothetical protein